MTDVLVIWNMVPEDCRAYLLQFDAEGLERVKRCAGQYGNTEEASEAGVEEDIDWLQELLESHTPSEEGEVLRIEAETLVVITGFLL